MYFVSMNNAIASKNQTINTTIQYRKVGIECSVNQSTRVVTARLGIETDSLSQISLIVLSISTSQIFGTQ